MARPDIETMRATWGRTYGGSLEPVIAEVRALLAYVAELEEIAHWLADNECSAGSLVDDLTSVCIFCNETTTQPQRGTPAPPIEHTVWCPVTLARQLLTNQASRTLTGE
jgi:hypothetical protein